MDLRTSALGMVVPGGIFVAQLVTAEKHARHHINKTAKSMALASSKISREIRHNATAASYRRAWEHVASRRHHRGIITGA